MKGIVLAGGNGTRLAPLTDVISKQLLPVYDKPMIYYPLATLKKMFVVDVLIITKPEDQEMFRKQLGDGSQFDMRFTYAVQENPTGIPDAFIIGEDFIGNDNVILILGDNVFVGDQTSIHINSVYGYRVNNPEQYGVFDLDRGIVVEKPTEHISDWACVGLYVFDSTCVEKAKRLTPSERGELEISDLINSYKNIKFATLRDSIAWFDCGTVDDLNECSNYIRALKRRTNIKIGL